MPAALPRFVISCGVERSLAPENSGQLTYAQPGLHCIARLFRAERGYESGSRSTDYEGFIAPMVRSDSLRGGKTVSTKREFYEQGKIKDSQI